MIAGNLSEVGRRIAQAAERSGRTASAVTLVAVSKGQPRDKIDEAIAAGQRSFGENYAQEIVGKFRIPEVQGLQVHFIGHLQRNKVKAVLPYVSLIHSVDSLELAREIDKRSAALGRVVPVLIEVNLGAENSKTGLPAAEVEGLVRSLADLGHIDLRGLMTVPPAGADPESARPFFRKLREIRDAIDRQNLYKHPLPELSMGMTHDFEVAVEEGATIVRVGTGIFGERQKK